MKRLHVSHYRSIARNIILALLLVFSGCTSLTTPEQNLSADCFQTQWPWEQSDLQPDPALHTGRLKNGMRYVIMQNREPRDRVALQLGIFAGSLQETEEQRGLAHFLEHMLFNGTTHYPPGTLVEYFQSIGMGFGADTNAHTSYDQTVYKLLLPSGSREHLAKGMEVMADYARGALLLESEVNRERGVILAEKRARDSAAYRVRRDRMHFTFLGTRAAERDIIGVDETLESMDAELLRQYYDWWYRPENMVMVVVGDVEPSLAREVVESYMASLQADPATKPECPDFGSVVAEGNRFFYTYEPDLGRTELTLETVWPTKPVHDTLAWEQEELKKYVAVSILKNRLERLARQAGSPITQAKVYNGIFLERTGYASISAFADANKWEPGLELLNKSLRQALLYGFSEQELERVKKEIMAYLKKEVQTASSRDSSRLAATIINKLVDNEVVLSPQQDLELFGPYVEKLSLAEVNEAFQKIWRHDNRLAGVAGTAQLTVDDQAPRKRIAEVFAASAVAEITPWQEKEAVAFPYLSFADKEAVVTKSKQFQGIDAYRVAFANGTILNYKKTDFKEKEVQLAVHFGHGLLSQPKPGLAKLAESVLYESGFGEISRDDVDEVMAAHNIKTRFQVGEESFVVKGRSLTSDLELLLQLVATQLEDPAFRPEAFALSRERFFQMYDQMESSVEGGLQLYGEPFLAGENHRYGMVSRENFAKLTLNDIEQWLEQPLKAAPLEISLVGDFDPQTAVALVGKYLGLQERKSAEFEDPGKVSFPTGKSLKKEIPSSIDKALVMVVWPTDDFWDISRTRRLNVLASVLDDRLRREIREKLGATYSPVVYNRSSRVDKGYGTLRSYLVVDPAVAVKMVGHVEETARALAQNGPTQDEMTRALKPTLTSIKDMMRNNDYWLNAVLSLSSRHPQQLDWPLSIEEDFASVSREDMATYAAKYLQTDHAATVVLVPGKKAL